MSGPFKMKGSPMKRNFGISPMKDKLEGDGVSPKTTAGHDKMYGVGHTATTREEHLALKPKLKEKLPKDV